MKTFQTFPLNMNPLAAVKTFRKELYLEGRIFDGLLYYCKYYGKYNFTTTNTTIII